MLLGMTSHPLAAVRRRQSLFNSGTNSDKGHCRIYLFMGDLFSPSLKAGHKPRLRSGTSLLFGEQGPHTYKRLGPYVSYPARGSRPRPLACETSVLTIRPPGVCVCVCVCVCVWSAKVCIDTLHKIELTDNSFI